jgi:ABC-2 type transport system permease protein
MNSNLADVAAGEGPREAAPAARIGTASTLLMLIRRELWEHRALWIAPLVVAALMVCGAVVAGVKYHLTDADMSRDDAPGGMAMFAVMQGAASMPLSVVSLIVVAFYLLDCLYAERKDRSILFWKSLPVSDEKTVLSKLLVALLVVPLGVFALGLLVSLSFVGVWELNAAFGRLPPIPGWDTLAWLKGEMALLACVMVGVLWYAPFAAYLLVVSAWARRSPFLWATVPVVLAPLLERMAFGTTYLWNLLAYRTYGIWQTLFPYPHLGRGRADALASVFGQLRFGAAFRDIDLWLGLAVTAALVFAAIRLRRYRDDT